MKSVIVNRHMEPITIVDLPREFELFLQRHNLLVLQCMDPPKAYYDPTELPLRNSVRTVNLRPLVRQLTILVTDQEVDALTLKSAFLPGQQAAVGEVHERGRRQGFRQGLTAMGDIASQLRRGLQQKREDD